MSLAPQGAHDATEMLARYSAQQQQFSELQQKKEEKSARLQQLREEMESLGTNRLGNDPYFDIFRHLFHASVGCAELEGHIEEPGDRMSTTALLDGCTKSLTAAEKKLEVKNARSFKLEWIVGQAKEMIIRILTTARPLSVAETASEQPRRASSVPPQPAASWQSGMPAILRDLDATMAAMMDRFQTLVPTALSEQRFRPVLLPYNVRVQLEDAPRAASAPRARTRTHSAERRPSSSESDGGDAKRAAGGGQRRSTRGKGKVRLEPLQRRGKASRKPLATLGRGNSLAA